MQSVLTVQCACNRSIEGKIAGNTSYLRFLIEGEHLISYLHSVLYPHLYPESDLNITVGRCISYDGESANYDRHLTIWHLKKPNIGGEHWKVSVNPVSILMKKIVRSGVGIVGRPYYTKDEVASIMESLSSDDAQTQKLRLREPTTSVEDADKFFETAIMSKNRLHLYTLSNLLVRLLPESCNGFMPAVTAKIASMRLTGSLAKLLDTSLAQEE